MSACPALAGFVLGIWIGTGWLWWLMESRRCPPRAYVGYRLWRAFTWFPLTIYYPLRDLFRGDR